MLRSVATGESWVRGKTKTVISRTILGVPHGFKVTLTTQFGDFPSPLAIREVSLPVLHAHFGAFSRDESESPIVSNWLICPRSLCSRQLLQELFGSCCVSNAFAARYRTLARYRQCQAANAAARLHSIHSEDIEQWPEERALTTRRPQLAIRP